MVLSSDSLANIAAEDVDLWSGVVLGLQVPHPLSAEPANAMAAMAGTTARFTSM